MSIKEKSLMLENKEVVKLLYSPSNSLFLSFWYLPTSFFKATGIPGWKHGVSGSIAANTNIAVNNHISFERKKAAVEVLKYITLESTQKELIMKNGFFSAINKLYDDPEVCKIAACDLMKGITPFSYFNYDLVEFSNDYNVAKYTQYLFDYLMDDMSLSEAIKKIDDMSKNYHFSIISDDTSYGLVIFIIFISVSVIMVLSLSMLYIEETKYKYSFLSDADWVINILGCFIIMCSVFTLFGDPTNITCHLRSFCISMGFIINLAPIIYKMVVSIPVNNKITNWTNYHKNRFKIYIIAIGILLNGITLFSSYDIERIEVHEGESFLKCSMNNIFGNISFYMVACYVILNMLALFIILFIDWNIRSIHFNTRFILATLCIDILFLILYLVIIKIKIRNYITYNLLFDVTIFGFSITNYLFLYLSNVSIPDKKKKERHLLSSSINKRTFDGTEDKSSYNNNTYSTSNYENIVNNITQSRYI